MQNKKNYDRIDKKYVERQKIMTNIYFIRHAQSERNFTDEMQRPLTREGTLDADALAEFMEKYHIDAVLSSPYKRAFDTVLPIAMVRGLDIKTDERLRERDAGSWKGENFLEYIEMQWEDPDFSTEGGESINAVQRRGIAAVNDILVKYCGQSIAVGTHGTALSAILNYYDSSFGFRDFMRILDLMPYVIKLSFKGETLVSKTELFKKERKYDA